MYDKACKSCKTRLSEFYRTGMLGCPDCYAAFEPEIAAALKKIQGGSVHVGKVPKFGGVDKELLNEYRRLLEEKERAGLEKRFSDMAELSEEIAELAEELKRRGLM